MSEKLRLDFYELTKLPKIIRKDDLHGLWLALFNAKTEEELMKILELEVPIMNEAIAAYRSVTASDEFRELERMRIRTRNDEISALTHARKEGENKILGIVAAKDAELAHKDAALADRDAQIANRDAEIAEQKALVAQLTAQINAQKLQ